MFPKITLASLALTLACFLTHFQSMFYSIPPENIRCGYRSGTLIENTAKVRVPTFSK